MQVVVCLLSTSRLASTSKVRILAAIGLMLFIGSAPGCKQSSDKVSVRGNVSYRGEPIERASMTFIPAHGRTESTSVQNGAYAIELAPGDYTITLLIGVDLPKGYKEGDTVPPPKIVLPAEYTSPSNSTLKATVKAGQDAPIDFELK